MKKSGTQRSRTPMKISLWALKPRATEYSFVAYSIKGANDVSKNLYLSVYPNSTFKISKKMPKLKSALL